MPPFFCSFLYYLLCSKAIHTDSTETRPISHKVKRKERNDVVVLRLCKCEMRGSTRERNYYDTPYLVGPSVGRSVSGWSVSGERAGVKKVISEVSAIRMQ